MKNKKDNRKSDSVKKLKEIIMNENVMIKEILKRNLKKKNGQAAFKKSKKRGK